MTTQIKTVEIKGIKKAGRSIKWNQNAESAVEAAIRMALRDDKTYFVYANGNGFQVQPKPAKFQGNFKVSIKGDEAEIEFLPYNFN